MEFPSFPRFPRILWTTIVALSVMVLLSGCAARQKFDSPYPKGPKVLPGDGLEEVAALLQERTREHPFLWRRGRVILRNEETGEKLWFEATLLYRDPDAVRLRGGRAPLGTLFELGVSGDDAWVFLNREKELYTGTLEDLRREGGDMASLSLRDVMSAILVNQDLQRRLSEQGGWTVYGTAGELFLSRLLDDGRRGVWRIGRSDGLVREVVIWARGERQADARVLYRSYELEDGEPLPGEFQVGLAGDAATVLFRLDGYKVGQTLDSRVFEAPAAEITLPLSRLSERESVIPPEE